MTMEPLALLPEAITQAAARNPDHPAVAMAGSELSYGELDLQSNSFANMLLAGGVAPGDRVGLFAHKSIELLVALHGILKAGAVYVPINPDAPGAYVRHILEDCDITHLVVSATTRRTALPLAADLGIELCIGIPEGEGVACIDWEEVWSYPSHPSGVAMDGDDLAYIIFTSGSTGRPKGIMHTHRSGLAYGEVAAETYGFEASDRITNHAPLNFDLSLLELWGAIVVGATVVVIPEAHARLPASFSQMLEDEKVTVVNAVPFALIQLLHRGAIEKRDLSAVRWVLFGGEVYPTKDLRGLMRLLPHARFGNVYGPAEVNGVTYYIVPELPPDGNAPISIGRLYAGMEAMVVDADDREVAPGEAGELLIHSPTHMMGYWRQPELTAQSTYHAVEPDGTRRRWHRTGDLVKRGPDGRFELLGRKDRMVKTRGHRVELDEVEVALGSHVAVEQAVVYTVPDGEGSHQIEAAVTLHTGTGRDLPDSADLIRYAAGLLPRYAVPRVLRIVDEVPRTSTGKADRLALAEQASTMSA